MFVTGIILLSLALQVLSAELNITYDMRSAARSQTVEHGVKYYFKSSDYPKEGELETWSAEITVPAHTVMMLTCEAFNLPFPAKLMIDFGADFDVFSDADMNGKMAEYEAIDEREALRVHLSGQGQNGVYRCYLQGKSRSRDDPMDNENCECGNSGAGNRIVGGEEATPHSHPWQVGLTTSMHPYSGFHCGGSIISRKHVLTAAHCVDFEGEDIVVRVGEHHLSVGPDEDKAYNVRGTVLKIHPEYNVRSLDNDFALIELADALQFSANVKPVCLPRSNAGTFEGQQATTSGWGLAGNPGEAFYMPNALQEDRCKELYHNSYIAENMICALTSGKDSCQGDSGGPLVVEDRLLVGVTSWGFGCGGRYPGVYARVTEAVDDFISNNANGYCQK